MRTTIYTLRYAFYVIFHPFDGFWELKHQKKNTTQASFMMLAFICVVFIAKWQLTNFMFNSVTPENMNILFQLAVIILPLVGWVVINWSISTLLDGKGTMKQIWVSTVYALLPLALLYIPQIILSHLITLEEGMFYHFLGSLATLWSAALILIGNMTIHDYTMSKTVLISIYTILGMLAVIFLGMVFFSTIQQLFTFFSSIYLELKFRS